MAKDPKFVVLKVNAAGEFDKTQDTDLWVDVGQRIVWVCVQTFDGPPKFKLRVLNIEAKTPPNAPNPWPNGFNFKQTRPCGAPIISLPMLQGAQYKVYKATFEVWNWDESSRKAEWDPHWVVRR